MVVSPWDAMNFILYSDVNDRSISQSLGRPEYSYYFVLKAYRPVLESLGQVHVVSSAAEVDPLYRQLQLAGQDCLFLSFAPPHKTPTDLQCPVVCVIAWEYDSIPDDPHDDARHDWSRMLARHGRAITLSSHTGTSHSPDHGRRFPGPGIADTVVGRLCRGAPAVPCCAGQPRHGVADQGLHYR
jgi:hypothetical protein